MISEIRDAAMQEKDFTVPYFNNNDSRRSLGSTSVTKYNPNCENLKRRRSDTTKPGNLPSVSVIKQSPTPGNKIAEYGHSLLRPEVREYNEICAQIRNENLKRSTPSNSLLKPRSNVPLVNHLYGNKTTALSAYSGANGISLVKSKAFNNNYNEVNSFSVKKATPRNYPLVVNQSMSKAASSIQTSKVPNVRKTPVKEKTLTSYYNYAKTQDEFIPRSLGTSLKRKHGWDFSHTDKAVLGRRSNVCTKITGNTTTQNQSVKINLVSKNNLQPSSSITFKESMTKLLKDTTELSRESSIVVNGYKATPWVSTSATVTTESCQSTIAKTEPEPYVPNNRLSLANYLQSKLKGPPSQGWNESEDQFISRVMNGSKQNYSKCVRKEKNTHENCDCSKGNVNESCEAEVKLSTLLSQEQKLSYVKNDDATVIPSTAMSREHKLNYGKSCRKEKNVHENCDCCKEEIKESAPRLSTTNSSQTIERPGSSNISDFICQVNLDTSGIPDADKQSSPLGVNSAGSKISESQRTYDHKVHTGTQTNFEEYLRDLKHSQEEESMLFDMECEEILSEGITVANKVKILVGHGSQCDFLAGGDNKLIKGEDKKETTTENQPQVTTLSPKNFYKCPDQEKFQEQDSKTDSRCESPVPSFKFEAGQDCRAKHTDGSVCDGIITQVKLSLLSLCKKRPK